MGSQGMNTLEKLFSAIHNASSRRLKDYATKELIRQLPEYDDHVLYTLRTIYRLISDKCPDSRRSGALVLGAMGLFEYKGVFEISAAATEHVYLQAKDITDEGKHSKEKTRSGLIKRLKLDHADAKFIDGLGLDVNGTSNKLNTADIEEKKIENVYDFFEAINILIFSPDWYKRHGALLAHCAIFKGISERRQEEQRRPSQFVINLNPNLFSKIYEILQNDKFNDFIDDQTSAPVRETAAQLLFYIYPFVNDEKMIRLFVEFLKSNDWQVQFSGLIAIKSMQEHILAGCTGSDGAASPSPLVVDIFALVGPLIRLADEDVKYLAAELLDFFIVRVKLQKERAEELLAVCWEQIEDDSDIAHSKASLFLLLKNIYKEYQLAEPESFAPLYPCFTSPIKQIRESVVELCGIFKSPEIPYLLAEYVLLSTDKKYVENALATLRERLASFGENELSDFATHFFGIIASSIHQPYKENDFVCYVDTLFTKDGICSVGPDSILACRAALFSAIAQVDLTITSKTMLAATFKAISGKAPAAGACSNGTFEQIISERIEKDFKEFKELKKMPLGEFKKIVADSQYTSLYPLCNENAVEYVRMIACENISHPDISLYFFIETCEDFLLLVAEYRKQQRPDLEQTKAIYSRLIKEAYAATKGGTDQPAGKGKAVESEKKLEISAVELSDGSILNTNQQDIPVTSLAMRNCLLYFRCLGNLLFSENIISFISSDSDRLLFFSLTAKFYIGHEEHHDATDDELGQNRQLSALNTLFNEALVARNISILRQFISNLHYNEILVRHILKTSDLSLLDGLLDYSAPSFNVLFTKLALRNLSTSQSLLGRIIPSLYFTPDPSIAKDLQEMIQRDKEDMMMLVDPSKIPDYDIICPVETITLRDYQKAGIRWMAFLNRFHLNGILADDMGLGKTMQALAYVVSEMERTQTSLRVLVLCPSSLVGHWRDELESHFSRNAVVCGSKKGASEGTVVISSYDGLRRDTGFLVVEKWFMVIFDEGHLLKNRSTVLYSKASRLSAERKLILTGTPVHNSVDDLFSLMNIVMPGYLGTEAEFTAKYAVRVTEKNVEQMEGRLANLQKKILPFVMRRLKSEVLKDLPPKIVRDVSVELSAEHAAVYKDACGGMADGPAGVSYQNQGSGNALSLTRNMLRAASHPSHFAEGKASSKTAALREIFEMCGERKVLVFFQLKSTIEFVISELAIEGVLRLDGSVPPSKRSEVVTEFNSGAVQYLFLTTSIGGLGLNLVSADTVVFYEHDWNPFNDLQAMDRAHRLGQKNVVNVFRLISKNTIEEKVMNYQNFKVFVASSVVTQQNTDVEKMEMKDLLEKFGE